MLDGFLTLETSTTRGFFNRQPKTDIWVSLADPREAQTSWDHQDPWHSHGVFHGIYMVIAYI